MSGGIVRRVTPAMIEAGVSAFSTFCFGEGSVSAGDAYEAVTAILAAALSRAKPAADDPPLLLKPGTEFLHKKWMHNGEPMHCIVVKVRRGHVYFRALHERESLPLYRFPEWEARRHVRSA